MPWDSSALASRGSRRPASVGSSGSSPPRPAAPPQAQDPAEDEAEEDPAPAGDEAFIPSDDDAPGGLAAFAPAPALHRRKSSIGLGGLEASISDVLSKGRPAIVAEELVEALYKFFESSTISLAGLNVPAILQNQDP